MKIKSSSIFGRFFGGLSALALAVVFIINIQAATLSPALQSQINNLSNNAPVGVVIISFKTSSGLKLSHLTLLRNLGINNGVTFPTLGMVGAALNAGQIRALQNNSSVASIWSNDRLQQTMQQSRIMTGVDKIRTDAPFTLRNGGNPINGDGDFSVFVIDSGIDATHADLPLGTKVIQNTQRVVSTNTGNTGITIGGVAVNGLTPSVSIENVPNTDTVGHGTHCAGIVGGLGARSGGAYEGVAPGVKIVGSGGGAVILVLDALAGWEYGLSHQNLYKIRVITNSYGPLGGGDYDPTHPFVLASKMAYERNITVVFAGGNDGAAKNTLSPYAQSPWAIGVAAGTKDGMLVDFSSRGIPRAERLSDDNPNNDNAAPTITAPGTGRFFESSLARYGFTTDMISVRALGNFGVSSGLTNDTEIAPGLIPFYTQISGTSMATPFIAGVVALMLDADPTLTPSEIRQILLETTTKMPGYQDYEVGAGYVNAYAAVDKVLNRTKNYKNSSEPVFNTTFGEERPAAQTFHIDYDPTVSGENSVNATTFTVEENINLIDVFADVDDVLEIGNGNFVGVRITSPSGVNYSTAIATPVLGGTARQIVVPNPEAGIWRLEVRGARGLAAAPQASSPTQIALPGPVNGNVNQVRYILPEIADLNDHPQKAQIESALKNRVIDTYADGTFRPNQTVSREDLARSLVLNTPLRQTLGSTAKFTDVSGDLRNIAEAVTANGSTLRDYDFTPKGLISATGTNFRPADSVNRIDLAVALVRALGRDAEARGLANTDVTYEGSVITDNGQIPPALRGYVQIAINSGLFEAFPAEIIQNGSQTTILPGPRFEPETTVNRGTLAIKLNGFSQFFRSGS